MTAALLHAALLGLGAPALAHHNKGLPHYGYFENYPQVPTEEYSRIEGRWEVDATIFNFQGLDSRESSDTPDDVKFYVVLYDLETDHIYTGPLRVDILDDDGRVISTFERLEPNEEGVYISRETMPASGDYTLRLTFPEGRASLPFSVDLAGDGVPWGALAASATLVAVLFGLAMKGRQRRLARTAAPAPT